MIGWLALIAWLAGTLVTWPFVARALLAGVPNVDEADRWFVSIIALPISLIWPLIAVAGLLRRKGFLP